ncbi:MAG TPA: hypothetical protein VK589_00820, partial [Chryseolinea sp.]|nr:hypothetical protein [Chryseolinea sp.]
MAKKNREALREEEKRPINKKNLGQLLGILKFTTAYKGWFSIGLASLGLSTVTILAFPYLAGALLDVAEGKSVRYFNSIDEVAIALIVVLFVQGIFSFTRVYTFALVSERSLADL